MSQEERIKPVIIPGPKKCVDAPPGVGILHPFIPQIPFTVAIIGPRHRGKTVLLHHLLSKEKGMYGSFFKPQNIILYSPTYELDTTLHDLELKNVFSPPVRMPELLDEAIAQQEKFKKMDGMLQALIVMEDITQIQDAWTVLETLGYVGRHYGLNNLSVGHKLSSVPRGVRTQTQQWILFRPNEQSEWQWILDMFSRKKTQHIWLEALRRCWAVDHQFAYIDFERKKFSEIYRCGFNEPLFTPEEEAFMEMKVFFNPEVKREVELDDSPPSEEKVVEEIKEQKKEEPKEKKPPRKRAKKKVEEKV